MAAEASRDPASLSFTVFGGPKDTAGLKRHADAGVDRVVLQIASEPSDKVLPLLDQFAAAAKGL